MSNFIFSGTSTISTIFTTVIVRENGTSMIFGKSQYKDGSHTINYFNHSTKLEWAHNNIFISGEHCYQGHSFLIEGVRYVLIRDDKVRGVCMYTKE